MLPFIRSDLAQFTAYTPNPGEQDNSATADTTTPLLWDRLDTNETPLDLPEALKQDLARTYRQIIEANRYPDGSHAALKNAIAAYVNESAANCQPTPERLPSFTAASISVGNGSDELIRSLLMATCLGGEGAILVAQPTFSMYGILARTLGIPAIAVGRSAENFEIDMAAANRAIKDARTPPVRAVFVVHPNSPTGNALNGCELAWLRSLPSEILVVIDEAYFEFSGTSVVGELQQRPNWIVLRTFSKAFRLAAHRVGYAIGHPELIATLEKVRLPYNLPAFSQAAAQLALLEREQLLVSVPTILAERQALYAHLSQQPGLQVWPSAANFLHVRLRLPEANEATNDEMLGQICQALKTKGTLIRHTGGGLRITVGTAEENARTRERLAEALARMG